MKRILCGKIERDFHKKLLSLKKKDEVEGEEVKKTFLFVFILLILRNQSIN